MAKTLSFTFIFILLFSCSIDDNLLAGTNSQIAPPNWIRGTWHEENNDTIGFIFTDNDIIYFSNDDEKSTKEIILLANQVEEHLTAEQLITDDTYQLSLTSSFQETLIFKFSKINNDTMIWYDDEIEITLKKQQ